MPVQVETICIDPPNWEKTIKFDRVPIAGERIEDGGKLFEVHRVCWGADPKIYVVQRHDLEEWMGMPDA